jgi:exodeoxyribonuclease VIII
MNSHDYHALRAVSSHCLIEMYQRSPLHCWSRYIDKQRQRSSGTSATRLGSLVHTLVLEPQNLERDFEITDRPRRSYADKTFHALVEATGRQCVNARLMRQAQAMADAVRQHDEAVALLDGQAEHTFIIERGPDLLPLKGRLDMWREHQRHVVEFKTTLDASPSAFARTLQRYCYHLSAAFYLHLSGATRHSFIVAETQPPHAVALYHTRQTLLDEGQQLWQNALELFDRCWTADHWPGYDDLPLMEQKTAPRARDFISTGEVML